MARVIEGNHHLTSCVGTAQEDRGYFGETFQIPPPLMHQKDFILNYIEPLETGVTV
jgi:hypothetical protein